MTWPQLYPGTSAGSQFNPARLFKGAISPHIGRDQAVGTGVARLAPADGVVLAHGQSEKYGFWIAVRYDGSSLIERHHQCQAAGRRAVGRFKRGDVLARVGHPHLLLTETARRKRADWSGGAKWSSTGAHCHQELRRSLHDEASAIDPRSAEATASWARVSLIATAGSELAQLIAQEADAMPLPIRLSGQHLFVLAPGQLAHIADGTHAAWLKDVLTSDDKWIDANTAQMVAALDAFGIPRDALIVDARGARVFNPETGQHVAGGLWNWQRVNSAKISAIKPAAVDEPAVERASESGARKALAGLTLKAAA